MGPRMKSGSRRSWRSWLSILLIAAMVFTMLPAAGVMAASASIVIENLYVSATRPSVTNDSVDRFSINPITLEATIQGINPDQVPNIYYEITNMNSGVTTVNKGNPAVLGSDGFTITFTNVYLTEGLNRIVIKLDGTSVVTSQPGWAYYTPATRIDGLKVNGQDFIEGNLYPESSSTLTSRLIEISGTAYNATNVTVQLYGSSQPYNAAIYGNRFSIIADHESSTSNANFRLKAGDNLFTFTANNPSHSYQVQRMLTYDNGDAFAYQVSLAGERLVYAPVFEHNDNVTELELKARLKVDIDSTDSGYRQRYDTLTIRVGSFTHTMTLDPAQSNASLSKPNQYNIYDLSGIQIPISALPTTSRYHDVVFEFSNALQQKVQTVLGFYYVRTNRAYIQQVTRKTGPADTTGTRLSQTAITEIPEQPAGFYVYGDSKTDNILVYIDNDPYTTTVVKDNDDPHKFYFEIEGLKEGQRLMTIVPVDADGDHEAGKQEYYLQINSTPYAIFSNVINGMVINNMLDLTLNDCINPNVNSCIAVVGRLMNVPQGELGKVKVYLNDIDITPHFYVNHTTKEFNIELSPTDNQANSLREGRNTIVIEINGVQRATSSVEIYKFTKAAPELVSVNIVQNVANLAFTEGSVPNSYFTTEKTVTLTGVMANVDEISIRMLRQDEPDKVYYTLYKDPDHDGTFSLETYDHLNMIQSIDRTNFTTIAIPLAVRGDTTIEFFVTNSDTNITVTRTITITRNASPYTIKAPKTYLVNGVPRANINGNYAVIEIEAEYADSISFGKNGTAVYDDQAKVFRYEARDLKSGANTINFTVKTGEQSVNGSLVLYNVNQPTVGAQYKTKMKTSGTIKAFDGQLELSIQRGTSLKRYGGDYLQEQFITDERWLLFGIANELNGEVDPVNDPAYVSVAPVFTNRDARFQTASELYWIDAGVINVFTDRTEAYTGSGQLPLKNMYYMFRQQADLVVPTKPMELTIKYDDSIVRDAWRYLTVFQYNIFENKNGVIEGRWVNIGGVVDTSKRTITVPIDRFGYFQVMYMDDSFDDVILHNYAKNELDLMYAKGYMEPKNPTANLFVPNDPITRGEFITLLMKLYPEKYPLNYKGDLTFKDVYKFSTDEASQLYDYRYIETAARAGIVRGVGGGRFNPGETITREDAAAMIARVADLKLESNPDRVAKNLSKYTDSAGINIYQQSSVEAVTRTGLMTGKAHNVAPGEKQTYYFDPQAPITRAEAAVIATRILQNAKKIPK